MKKALIFIFFIGISIPNFGQSWEALGPFYGKSKKMSYLHSMGLVSALLTNSEDENELIMATNSSGIWKTKDRGENWKCVTENTKLIPGFGVFNISENPENTNQLIAAASNFCYGPFTYGGGVLMSNDRGDSWYKNTSFDSIFEGREVKDVHYTSSKIIHVLTEKKLYKSIDGGKKWEIIFKIDSKNNYIDNKDQQLTQFKILKNGTIFTCSSHQWGSEGNIWRSVDKGKTWQNLLKTKQFDNLYDSHVLFATLTEPVGNLMYVAVPYKNTARIYKSIDLGNNFYFHGDLPTNGYNIHCKSGKFELQTSLTNPNIIFIGSVDLFQWDSINNLKQLSPNGNVSADEHDDVRVIFSEIRNGKEVVIMGNDGGVSLYHPEEKKIESINGNKLPTIQAYNMAVSQFDSNFKILIGTQDNGTYEYEKGEWNFVSGGDGGGNAFTDDGIISAKSSNNIVILNKNRKNKTYSPSTRYSNWYLDFPVEFSEKDKLLYFGSGKNDKSVGASIYIQPFFGSRTEGKKIEGMFRVGEIAISKDNRKKIFVAEGEATEKSSGRPKLVKTIDEFKNFIDLTDALVYPNPFIEIEGRKKDTLTLRKVLDYKIITDIEIDPHNEDIIYVSISGNLELKYWSQSWEYYRVLRSEDGGESWYDYSAGLPLTPIHCLLRDERDESTLICGGDEGVYIKKMEEDKWKEYNLKFPQNTTVTDLKLNYCQGNLYCSTYGRGVYSTYFKLYNKQKGNSPWKYTKLIKKNTEIKEYKFIKSSFRIKKGQTLTIKSTVKMSPYSTIILEPKSTLIVDGGSISSSCINGWNGVIIEEKRFLFFFKRKKGKITLKNGGEIH